MCCDVPDDMRLSSGHLLRSLTHPGSRDSRGLGLGALQRALWLPWAVASPQCFPGLLLAFIQAERGCFSETPSKCVSMILIFISLKFILTQWPLISSWVEQLAFTSPSNFPESFIYGINFESLALILRFGNSERIFFQSFCLGHEHQKSILVIHFFMKLTDDSVRSTLLSCGPLKGSKHISWSGFNDGRECGIKRN